jgi:hypothetical protein
MSNRLRLAILVGGLATLAVVGTGSAAIVQGRGLSNESSGRANLSGPPNAVVTSGTGVIVWKDATGTVIPFFQEFGFGGSAFTDLQGGMFADGNGTVWSFNLPGNIGTIQPAYSAYNYAAMVQYWDGTNCTGTPYVPYAHARFAFNFLEQSKGTTMRAVQDGATASMQFMQSYWNGSCTNQVVHVLVTPQSQAPIVTPPGQLPFTLPVHAELM